MQSSNIPNKSPKVFAESAGGSYTRVVPQTTADPAAASFDIGFPPQTFTDESAGGTPPDGRDFNGILNYLSAWVRWLGAGGSVPYDSSFQTNVSGYPRGARVPSAISGFKRWISTTENNTTNPDAGGAGWVPEVGTTYASSFFGGSGSVVVPSWASFAEIQVIGAGGGGGGVGANYSGGGGGAGGFGYGVIPVTPGATLAYTVGTGGSGSSSGTGGNGSSTTIAGITATGGNGGSASSIASGGGGGGSCSGAPISLSGGDGADGNNISRTVQGGSGAPGPFGGNGRAGSPNGTDGRAAGSGGGGAWGPSAGAGGRGADGAIIIRWLV